MDSFRDGLEAIFKIYNAGDDKYTHYDALKQYVKEKGVNANEWFTNLLAQKEAAISKAKTPEEREKLIASVETDTLERFEEAKKLRKLAQGYSLECDAMQPNESIENKAKSFLKQIIYTGTEPIESLDKIAGNEKHLEAIKYIKEHPNFVANVLQSEVDKGLDGDKFIGKMELDALLENLQGTTKFKSKKVGDDVVTLTGVELGKEKNNNLTLSFKLPNSLAATAPSDDTKDGEVAKKPVIQVAVRQ